MTVVIPVRDRHTELDRCLAGLREPPDEAMPGPRARVIVVDDASADPAAIAAIAARHGADVIRRPVNGGPGAARNSGLAAVDTALVAFLDSDCVPRPGWLANLLPHFADPVVGAVAPRIVPHEQGTGWLARYEGASSTLDMGARPSIVRPGARVSYVPGAALVVRRAAAGDGFRDAMYVGEDVDFVWRLPAAGWRVRYEPRAVMGHDHRVSFRAWFSRRADYGTSAADLERLHPGSVRPLYASWWTVGAWAAALSGRPVTAAAVAATATALLARRLSRVTGERWPLPARPSDNSNKRSRRLLLRGDGPRLNVTVRPSKPPRIYPQPKPSQDNSKKRGSVDPQGADAGMPRNAQAGMPGGLEVGVPRGSGVGVPGGSGVGVPVGACVREGGESRSGTTAGRAALPGGGGAWRLALRLAGGGTLAAGRPLGSALSRTWWPVAIPAALAIRRLRLPVAALILAPPLLDWADRRPPLDPVRYVAARLLDDAAYSIGVWRGCLARRTIRPLLPVIGGKR